MDTETSWTRSVEFVCDCGCKMLKKKWVSKFLLTATFAGSFLPSACAPLAFPDSGSEADGPVTVPQLHEVPIGRRLTSKMGALQMQASDPLLIRVFKSEKRLEVWKKPESSEQFLRLTSFPICAYSGELGPKFRQGDRQAPEGFYHISASQLNPWSSYHLSLDLGFPNRYDQANARDGSYLMIHGGCKSAGCYAMGDRAIEEIYALVREALRGGQNAVEVQIFPFRMWDDQMLAKASSPYYAFWKNLKQGYDLFEKDRVALMPRVCKGRYVFNSANYGLSAQGSCGYPSVVRRPVEEAGVDLSSLFIDRGNSPLRARGNFSTLGLDPVEDALRPEPGAPYSF